MKQLTEFTKNGYHFQLEQRTGDVAIFKGQSTKSKSLSWEVIKIQSHHGRIFAGKIFMPAEYPPSNEQFGAKGWSFSNHDLAMRRFKREVVKTEMERGGR